jgi:hypothetical protein
MFTNANDGIACPLCGGTTPLSEIRRQLEPPPAARFDAQVSSLLDLVIDIEEKGEVIS